MNEEKLMLKAIDYSKKAKGKVFPNPYVGCLIIKNNKIIAKGKHNSFGSTHAEVNALRKAGSNARNATMIVSLEPCSHYGKQPPCTQKIIKAGIKKVVIGVKDFNPVVRGKGIKELKKAGIKVELIETRKVKEKFIELNEPFIKFTRKNKPFVLLKIALSKDGMISFGNRKKKKISSKKELSLVQELRRKANAVLVGINTVLKDNPSLTYRKNNTENPVRAVLDDELKIPINARLLKEKGKIIVFCGKKASKRKELSLKKKFKEKIEVIRIKNKEKHLDLNQALKELGKRNIAFLLVEGGQKISSSFLKEKKADKLMLAIADKKLANKKNALFFVDERIKNIELRKATAKKISSDLIVEGYFIN